MDRIHNLLIFSPGNLVFHLVLVIILAGTLWAAVQALRSGKYPHASRVVLGLGLLLGLRLVPLLISSLAWRGWLDPGSILPPLERAVTGLSLIIITWMWAFPIRSRVADISTLVLGLLGLILFALTLLLQPGGTSGEFNTSLFERLWQGFCLAVAVLGILVMVVRRRPGWQIGMVMLLLAGLGHMWTLILPGRGDFPGFVRLSQLAYYPLLLTVINQLTGQEPKRALILARGKVDQGALPERRRYSTDLRTIQALMQLAAETDTVRMGPAFTRGIAQAMLADLCFLLVVEDKNTAITCGYDLIREEVLTGCTVDKDSLPAIMNSIKRGRSLRLTGGSRSADLDYLAELLNLNHSGNLLSVPVQAKGEFQGAVLILSPYSERLWNAEDQAYLDDIARLFLPILQRSRQKEKLESSYALMQREASTAKEETGRFRESLGAVAAELEQVRADLTQSRAKLEAAADQEKELDASRLAMIELQARVEKEQASRAAEIPLEDEQGERDLRTTLQEVAHMQNALAEANSRIVQLEQSSPTAILEDQMEVLTSISQDLRQPMSSIIGYTDLLLGESVGILGALQRKFVERIKASTERVGALVDDLIQVTNLDTGRTNFKPAAIDLNLIIDNSMAQSSTQIREKNITLRLDIPDDLPFVKTDRDALQQIFIHLLQNATAASQVEGTITLRVQMQAQEDEPRLSIQVTDTGGGIASQDIPKVFARRYRAENALIQGLGDTGVGLSIAKSLVESQSGRIWVETEMGKGSTFNVLLPVTVDGGETG